MIKKFLIATFSLIISATSSLGNEFIGVMGLVDTPSLKFEDDFVIVSDSSGRSKVKYFYSAEETLTTQTFVQELLLLHENSNVYLENLSEFEPAEAVERIIIEIECLQKN